jgi:hypothetical protein
MGVRRIRHQCAAGHLEYDLDRHNPSEFLWRVGFVMGSQQTRPGSNFMRSPTISAHAVRTLPGQSLRLNLCY